MRNKYKGICYRCGKVVEPRQGHFEKIQGTANQWRVQHAECCLEHRKNKEAQKAEECSE